MGNCTCHDLERHRPIRSGSQSGTYNIRIGYLELSMAQLVVVAAVQRLTLSDKYNRVLKVLLQDIYNGLNIPLRH